VEWSDAFEFANLLNTKIILPSFSVADYDDNKLVIVGRYYIPTQFRVTSEFRRGLKCCSPPR
jgi:hypothetical protein